MKTSTQAILLISALIPIICFALLGTTLGIGILPLVLGVILGFPSAFSIKNQEFASYALYANSLALALIVGISTWDLWDLLEGARPNMSIHLLSLSLALILGALQQVLLIHFAKPTEELSPSELIGESLRGPSVFLSLMLSLITTNFLLVWLSTFEDGFIGSLSQKLLERGIIPPLTLLAFFWGLYLLIGKYALFFLEHRKFAAQASLIQMAFGKVSKKSLKDNLHELLWQAFDSFYTLPRYINWAIPILGFIGTVLGISLATENLGSALGVAQSEFSNLLGSALEPLGIAFDTTLVALSLSIVLALLQTLLYRWEERKITRIQEELL